MSPKHFVKERCRIMEPAEWPQNLQRFLTLSKFGRCRNFQISFVLLKNRSNKNTKLWMIKIIPLLRVQVKRCDK